MIILKWALALPQPDDLGTVAVDVNYLNVGGAVPNYQIFVC